MSISLIVAIGVTLALLCVAAGWFLGPWRHDRRNPRRFLVVALVAPLIGSLVAAGGHLSAAAGLSYMTALVPVGAGVLFWLARNRKSTG